MNIHIAISQYMDEGKPRERIMMERLYMEIKRVYGVDRVAIKSKSRRRYISFARHVFCYIMCTKGGLSTVTVGKEVNRHHASVLNGVRVIKDVIWVTAEERDRVNEILLRL